MTEPPLASPRFPIEAVDPARYPNDLSAGIPTLAEQIEEMDAAIMRLTVAIEQRERKVADYRAALQRIADTGAPRSSGIARAALGQSD